MNFVQLIQHLEPLQSTNDPVELARMALLVIQTDPHLERFEDPAYLNSVYRDVQMRIQATSDQHAAVAEELDLLVASDPHEFSPEHVWTLIRAIKVQSHILQMYIGHDSCSIKD